MSTEHLRETAPPTAESLTRAHQARARAAIIGDLDDRLQAEAAVDRRARVAAVLATASLDPADPAGLNFAQLTTRVLAAVQPDFDGLATAAARNWSDMVATEAQLGECVSQIAALDSALVVAQRHAAGAEAEAGRLRALVEGDLAVRPGDPLDRAVRVLAAVSGPSGTSVHIGYDLALEVLGAIAASAASFLRGDDHREGRFVLPGEDDKPGGWTITVARYDAATPDELRQAAEARALQAESDLATAYADALADLELAHRTAADSGALRVEPLDWIEDTATALVAAALHARKPEIPDSKDPTTGVTTLHLRRACNGCGNSLGQVEDRDVTVIGTLADVTGECPTCIWLDALDRRSRKGNP